MLCIASVLKSSPKMNLKVTYGLLCLEDQNEDFIHVWRSCTGLCFGKVLLPGFQGGMVLVIFLLSILYISSRAPFDENGFAT